MIKLTISTVIRQAVIVQSIATRIINLEVVDSNPGSAINCLRCLRIIRLKNQFGKAAQFPRKNVVRIIVDRRDITDIKTTLKSDWANGNI